MAAKTNEPRSAAADRELAITRTFDAPRELVWKTWTQPEHVSRWWGPRGFSNTIEKMEVRPGGAWLLTMHGPDGRDYRNEIVYEVVEAPSRLVYTHGPFPRFRVEVLFADRGGKTELTMRMVFASAEERDRTVKTFNAEEGQRETMARLGEHLALATAARPVGPVLELERVFDAPVDVVWDAWTKPEHFSRWFGAKASTMPVCTLDPRPGGPLRFKHELVGAPGEVWVQGAFTEVVPRERLAFALYFSDARSMPAPHFMVPDWPADALITTTVLFEARGAKTKLVLRQVVTAAAPSARALAAIEKERNLARQGWAETVELLEAELARMRAPVAAAGPATAPTR